MPLLEERYQVKITRDVPYARALIHVRTAPIERSLCLDVYEPIEPPERPESIPSIESGRSIGSRHVLRRPALIMAFGGAYHRGSKEADEFDGGVGQRNTPVSAWCHAFAQRGYCAFSIDYRLIPEDPDPGTTPLVLDANEIPRSRIDHVRGLLGLGPSTPAMVRDGVEAACDDFGAAFEFVRTNADRFGIDPARIAVGGFSAGARMALGIALLQRVPVAAVVSLSGALSARELRSCVTGANAVPPAFFVSAQNDLDYIAAQAPVMAEHFEAAGADHEWWQVPGASHFYPASSDVIGTAGERDRLDRAAARFLDRVLWNRSAGKRTEQ